LYVTEAEWLASSDPQPMLASLRNSATERKLRLFAVACCHRVGCSLPDACRHSVAVAERHADGAATDRDLLNAYEASYSAWRRAGGASFAAHAGAGAARAVCMGSTDPARRAERSREIGVVTAASYAAMHAAELVAFATAREALDPLRVVRQHYLLKIEHRREYSSVGFWVYEVDDQGWAAAKAAERSAQCRLLHDIVANPFRPAAALDPACVAWRGEVVRALAWAAYDERLPEGTLNPARLALLADALEDAGCTDAALLGHLRSPGPHVRGCWAVDLVLGKS
jgi:hypothetical protein